MAKLILKALRNRYGTTLARDFGPIAFKAFRESIMATWFRKLRQKQEQKLRRTTINHYLRHVIATFRFAVENEKLPVETWQALKPVEPLRKGRTNAPEDQRIKPVDNAMVELTLPYLPPIVSDMVRLQRATAMRPMEVCSIRPMDIDRTGDIWIYKPATHNGTSWPTPHCSVGHGGPNHFGSVSVSDRRIVLFFVGRISRTATPGKALGPHDSAFLR